MRIELEQDGERFELTVPMSCQDITFSDYCDFREAEGEYFDLNIEGGPAVDDDGQATEIMAALTQAVCTLVPGADKLPLLSPEQMSISQLLKDGYHWDIGADLSVVELYAHLVVLISAYRPRQMPTELRLKHKGRELLVRRGPAARVLLDKPLTTGEFIEALEYRRLAEQNSQRQLRGGNLDFTLGLTQFAILVRQPGEQLPAEPAERARWLERRRSALTDLPLSDVLDVRFFFQSAILHYVTNRNTSSSGKARRVQGGGRKKRKRTATVKRLPN